MGPQSVLAIFICAYFMSEFTNPIVNTLLHDYITSVMIVSNLVPNGLYKINMYQFAITAITCVHLYKEHVHIPWYTIPLIIFGHYLIDDTVNPKVEPVHVPQPVPPPPPQITDIMNTDAVLITFE